MNLLLKRKNLFILLFVLFAIFFINAFHEEYPDEYDSILGGKFIMQGKLIYKDWFQHHQPGAYILASLILPFTGISFVRFRIILSFVFFGINVLGAAIIKKRIKNHTFNISYYLAFLFLVAVSGTYFWWQMLLADTLSAYLFIPAYSLLFLKIFYNDKLSEKDISIITILSFFGWFTSMTYVYLTGFINILTFFVYFRSKVKIFKLKFILDAFFRFFIIAAFPYFIFAIYLLITGSLKDYIFSAFTYNTNYYIYNAEHAVGSSINPVRYSITIGVNFLNNFWPALTIIKGFNLESPLVPTLAISNLVIFIFLILKRRFLIAFLVFGGLIYACARANPLGVRQTDYQSSLYIMLSMINGIFALFFLKNSLDETTSNSSSKILEGFSLIVLTILYIYTSFHISLVFVQKFYDKYMGKAPLIYDRPQVANLVNEITTKNDFAWIGPFEFKEIFYLKNVKMPSKYHWFLQHAAVSKIKNEMLSDFEKNRAKVIVFQRNYSPWGGKAADFNYFFTDFLDENYFRFNGSGNDVSSKYKWNIPDTLNFNIAETFNFDKNRKNEIIAELLDKNLIVKK